MIRLAPAVLASCLLLGACDTGDIGSRDTAEPSFVRAADQPAVGDGLLVARYDDDIGEIHEAVVECLPAGGLEAGEGS